MVGNVQINLVFVAKKVSFRDINNKTITPFQVHSKQVTQWLFDPADALLSTLCSTPFNEMALFGLQLMFFEMHGKFRLREPDEKQSGRKFKEAWLRFQEFCEDCDQNAMSQDNKANEIVWKYGRCGLFHALHISEKLSVDYGGLLDKKLFGDNPLMDQKLISPKNIQPYLKKFFAAYLQKIESDGSSLLTINFHKSYESFITKPLEFFKRAENWK